MGSTFSFRWMLVDHNKLFLSPDRLDEISADVHWLLRAIPNRNAVL